MLQTKNLDKACAGLVHSINLYGIPVAALARLSGLSRPTIYAVLNGGNVGLATLKKVDRAIDDWRAINNQARRGIKQ